MIQNIDSKHLITVWMDSPRWAQLMLNAGPLEGLAIVSHKHKHTHTATHTPHTHLIL